LNHKVVVRIYKKIGHFSARDLYCFEYEGVSVAFRKILVKFEQVDIFIVSTQSEIICYCNSVSDRNKFNIYFFDNGCRKQKLLNPKFCRNNVTSLLATCKNGGFYFHLL
jgi:hypothetical protein